MIQRLVDLWASLSWGYILFGVLGIIVTFVVSYVVVTVILVKMPANYFHSDYEHHFLSDRHPLLRAFGIAAKNTLGVFVIITGIVLSLPGVPGPGLLTIFIGIMMTDIPGKRSLEVKIIHRPVILGAINRLRSRYGKPELLLN